eukprot:GHVR01150926.1.p1 GENE.GHVR01150926.1~~GHVR01150926.1.p1  ORF type:complete len:107 (+),score=20.08 GHVR01150926.1:22-342(+)
MYIMKQAVINLRNCVSMSRNINILPLISSRHHYHSIHPSFLKLSVDTPSTHLNNVNDNIIKDLNIKDESNDVDTSPHTTIEYGYKYEGPEPTQHGDWAHGGRVSDF